MTAYRGEIWLANLNPSKKPNEIGKVRPVLIFQNDELNESEYPTTIVLPLTTSLINDARPLRYRVEKRDSLKQSSDLLIAKIRAIDNSRLIEKVAQLDKRELIEWRIDKTNRDYANELGKKKSKKEFKELTLYYEYVWYGDFEINLTGFENIHMHYKKYLKSLNN